MDALHTKYRPTRLEDVVGQDHAMAGLKAVLAARKQQAFIFEGPSGTGKTTLARICANLLGCSSPREIDAATHTGVDAMREVADGARFVSLDGEPKAFIVDECHRLTKQAWESLLKDIEEPPAGVYWFFCTTEGPKVPPNIQTRCVTISLKDVPWRKLLGLLASVAQKEGLDVADDILDVCAEEAGGSPRRALVNLTTVAHCKTADEARAALNRMSGAKEAFDLAKLLVNEFNFAKACAVLKELKEVPPESIRHTVRAYATTVVLNSPENRWARGVLKEFEKPAYDANQISDILSRVITLDKYKAAM